MKIHFFSRAKFTGEEFFLHLKVAQPEKNQEFAIVWMRVSRHDRKMHAELKVYVCVGRKIWQSFSIIFSVYVFHSIQELSNISPQKKAFLLANFSSLAAAENFLTSFSERE